MSDFKTFLGKYASEISGVGTALASVVAGIALQPAEREGILAVINQLDAAAQSILGGIDNVSEGVTIREADVETAVKNVAPSLMGPMVQAEVQKELSAMSVPTDVDIQAMIDKSVAAAIAALPAPATVPPVAEA